MSTATTTIENFIGGEFRAAADGASERILSPATGQAIASAPLSATGDVDAAVAAASAAFEGWSQATPGDRSLALLRIADALEQRGEELSLVESLNVGKPIAAMRDEIPFIVDNLRFFAGAARCLEGRAAGEYMAGYTSMLRREPLGVLGQIVPWNYPLMMAIWKIGPALAAGNTVVLKPSEQTPMTAALLASICGEHLPAGVLNVVFGHGEAAGAPLVRHPDVAMVSLTGDVETGKAVARAAADTLKRVHLELGGKAPVLVFDDADVEAAIAGVRIAGYFNAGQDCTAATRVLAGPRVHDDFVAALEQQARTIRTGPPDDGEVLYGPLNNANQLAHVSGFIERTPDHATVVAGGRRQGDRGYFFEPTVVDGLRQDDEMIQNEIFGPVISVQTFDDEDEALAWANGVPFALASSVWTEDHGRAMRMSRRLDFGCVWVNCHIPLVAEMPHGGYKHSGYGKDLSLYGMEDYTRIKHVMSYIERRDG